MLGLKSTLATYTATKKNSLGESEGQGTKCKWDWQKRTERCSGYANIANEQVISLLNVKKGESSRGSMMAGTEMMRIADLNVLK